MDHPDSPHRKINLKDAGDVLKGVSIPPRPQLLLDIQAVLPDIRKVAQLIQTDQGVSAGVLKAINSPLYGLPRRITSIQHAVMMLGLDNVINIVSSLLLRATIGSNLNPATLEKYWSTTTDTAVAASSLAKQLRVASVDKAYMLGLFHNCGMPMLMKKFPDYMDSLIDSYNAQGKNITDHEDKHYETNHAVAGYFVCRYWLLPTDICKVIRDHHSLRCLTFNGKTTDHEYTTLLAVLKMAEHIAGLHNWLGNNDEDYEWEAIKDNLLNYIGLSEADFDNVSAVASDEITQYNTVINTE